MPVSSSNAIEPVGLTSMALDITNFSTPGAFFDSLLSEERQATTQHRYASTSLKTPLATPIDHPTKPAPYNKYLKRNSMLAVNVAKEAFKPYLDHPIAGERTGLFVGYGGLRADWSEMKHALYKQDANSNDCWEKGLTDLHPFWILKHLSNGAHAIIAEELKIFGEGITLGGMNSGVQALASAIAALRARTIDRALVVTHDNLLEPETLVVLGKENLLTKAQYASEFQSAYSSTAKGFIPGEGCAAIMLERISDSQFKPMSKIEAWDAADGEWLLPQSTTLRQHIIQVARSPDFIEGASLALRDWDKHELEIITDLFGSKIALAKTLDQTGQLGSTSALIQCISMSLRLKYQKNSGLYQINENNFNLNSSLTKLESARTLKSGLGISVGFPGLLGLIYMEDIQ